MELGIDKIWQMIGNQEESNKPVNAKAVVLRKDNDGTIWVKIEGGVDETPVYSTTANVKPNDVVTVRVLGGKVYIEGSTSAPSVGIEEFGDAITAANNGIQRAEQKAEQAQRESDAAIAAAKAAEEATDVAKVTGQHFWFNDDQPETYGGAGAHVTEQTKEDWAESIRRRFPNLSDENPYHNFLMNSLGILLRSALRNLVSITRSAIAFFDGEGNEASNIIARFGKNGAQIGYTNDSHVLLDYHSLKLIDKNGNTYMYVGDLRDEDGLADVTLTFRGDGSQTIFRLDPLPSRDHIGDMVVTVSDSSGGTVTRYDNSVEFSTPPSSGATITVSYMTDSQDVKAYTFGKREGTAGLMSFVEGLQNIASGKASHAEGYLNNASDEYAHVEGFRNTAEGIASHAEGNNCVAQGIGSHAEGSQCVAEGDTSHVQNTGTYTGYENQTAMGVYNDNKSEDLLEVGNGDWFTRSNALELTRSGKLTLAGDVVGKSGTTVHKLSEKTNDSDRAKLEASIAYVENATAKTSHTTGGYFMLNNQLRRAKAAIAAGAAINDSNSEVVTVDGTKVSKAGDIMSGNLRFQNNNISTATIPSSQQATPIMQFGGPVSTIGLMWAIQRASSYVDTYTGVSSGGRVDMCFGVFNPNNTPKGVRDTALLRMQLMPTGVVSYYVDEPSAFRTAIKAAAATSDARLKTDIKPLGSEAEEFIDALEPCSYIINGKRQVGLLAQNVSESDKWDTDMAYETYEGLDDWERMEDGTPTWQLDYTRIIAPLVATVQAQEKRIEELESCIQEIRRQAMVNRDE